MSSQAKPSITWSPSHSDHCFYSFPFAFTRDSVLSSYFRSVISSMGKTWGRGSIVLSLLIYWPFLSFFLCVCVIDFSYQIIFCYAFVISFILVPASQTVYLLEEVGELCCRAPVPKPWLIMRITLGALESCRLLNYPRDWSSGARMDLGIRKYSELLKGLQ